MQYGTYKAWKSYVLDRPTSRNQYAFQSFLSGLSDIHRGYYSYRDNMAYMDDYMKNRGLDYGNILYPSRTDGWYGGSALGYGVKSVSRNFMDLYSPAPYRAKRGHKDVMFG